mmetsp:Transcript_82157/g.100799  ORF Transcript_82157/g.100799 Transcript_82157/m.100799 type:complete len:613 (+) Transcript_82157:47-1885(+)
MLLIIVNALVAVTLSERVSYGGPVRNTNNLGNKVVNGLINTQFIPVDKPFLTKQGIYKQKMQQIYKNIPIFGATIVVEWDNIDETNVNVTPNKRAIFGKYYLKDAILNILPDVTPKITADDALNRLNIAADKISKSDAELNIYYKNNRPYLAWMIHVYGDNPIMTIVPDSDDIVGSFAYFVVINALNGDIIDEFDLLNRQVPVSVCDIGGNPNTGENVYCDDTAFLLESNEGTILLDNGIVTVYDMHGSTFPWNEVLIECVNIERCYPDGKNDAYGIASDAFAYGNVVFDLYRDWMDGETPLNTLPLKLRVNYGNEFENAFWDGQQMTFGNGRDRFYPLVSLDVVAHEVAHGFTQQKSNLIYRDQSGGINEAYSDLAGKAGENYHRGSNNWLIGYDICKTCEALRFMDDPTKDGVSIDHSRDYFDGMNVHYSSGVYNKAFQLLTDTDGWNMEMTFKVASIANMFYWNANTDYNNGACGMEYAAYDLYGPEYILAVRNAFDVVGVCCSGDTNDWDYKTNQCPDDIALYTQFADEYGSTNDDTNTSGLDNNNTNQYKIIGSLIIAALVVFVIIIIVLCKKRRNKQLQDRLDNNDSLLGTKPNIAIYDTNDAFTM